MEKIIELTPDGFNALKEEFDQLNDKDRPEMLQHVEEARALGDLRENEAYQAARGKLAMIKGRIEELEHILKHAQISEVVQSADGSVAVGATVKLAINSAEKEFTLVFEHEADITSGKVSVDSPLGKGLIGMKVGDIIEIEVPAGMQEYRIIDIT